MILESCYNGFVYRLPFTVYACTPSLKVSCLHAGINSIYLNIFTKYGSVSYIRMGIVSPYIIMLYTAGINILH